MDARCKHGLNGCAKCTEADYRADVETWLEATPISDSKCETYSKMLRSHDEQNVKDEERRTLDLANTTDPL